MRISDANTSYFSIVWFGADRAGRLIAFLALGEGSLPEFVKKSEENTMLLFHYWYGHEDWDFSKAFDFRTRLDETVFAQKGLYVCVANDPYAGEKYRITQRPQRPALLRELPPHIQQIMQTHTLDMDAECCEYLIIEA